MALSKSERITLIQSAANALSSTTRIDAELALDTFEIEDLEFRGSSWNTYGYNYVVERLKPAPDETLINLSAHLAGDTVIPPDAGPWKEDHHRVFLSHTSTNRKLAGEVRIKLFAEEIDLFVAHDVIEPDQEWIEEIRVALATCETLIGLITPDIQESSWCDQEVGFALGRGIQVSSIMYGADPHGFISPKQAFEVNPDELHAATKIAQHICKLVKGEAPSTIPDPAKQVVRKYARSRSFDEARTNLKRVMKLKVSEWTPELVDIAEQAGRENGQVAEAWWFEESVPDVLIEHLEDIGVRHGSYPSTSTAGARQTGEPEIPF